MTSTTLEALNLQVRDFLAMVTRDSAVEYLAQTRQPSAIELSRMIDDLAIADEGDVAKFLADIRYWSGLNATDESLKLYALGLNFGRGLLEITGKVIGLDVPFIPIFTIDRSLRIDSIQRQVAINRSQKQSTLKFRLQSPQYEHSLRVIETLIKESRVPLHDLFYDEGSEKEVIRGFIDYFDAVNALDAFLDLPRRIKIEH